MHSIEKGYPKDFHFQNHPQQATITQATLDSLTKAPTNYAQMFFETYSVLIIDAKYFALYQDLGKLVNMEVNYAVLMFNDEHA